MNRSDIQQVHQEPFPEDWPVTRLVQVLRQNHTEIQDRYKVRSLWVFGSYVHNEQRPDSDLDILVEFDETPDLLKYANMQRYLSDLLGLVWT